MDRELLLKVASVVKETIELMRSTDFPPECQIYHSFPNGACGDTSMLLGRFLLDEFGVDSDYVCGSCILEGKEQWTHAWLECGSYKVDITADQFDEVSEKVIVEESHFLYEWYEADRPQKISKCFSKELNSSYKILCDNIKGR